MSLNILSTKLVDIVFGKMLLNCRGFNKHYEQRELLNAEKTLWYRHFTQKNLTSEFQIQRGIDELEANPPYMPPPLGDFLKWCKDPRSDFDRQYPLFDANCIESKKAQPEIAKREMDKIRAMLVDKLKTKPDNT